MANSQLVLIRGAKQLVTLRGPKGARRGRLLGELNIIPDGAVLIRDGIIEDVGISRRVERLSAARNATEIDATGRIVIPAFVDGLARVAYAHPVIPADAAALSPHHFHQDGLASTPRLRIESRCRAFLTDMLRHGTCTVEAQTGFGPGDSGELKILRTYRDLSGAPVDLVSTYFAGCPRTDSAHEEILRVIAKRKLARFVDIRCAPDAFTVSAARELLTLVRSLGFGLKMQAAGPTPDEAVALAIELAAVSVSHLDHLSPSGAGRLGASDVIATLCPGSAYQSGSGRFAPARALIGSGAAVSLASNFSAECSPFYSMPFVLSLACRHMRITVAEALIASTVNGAYAAGCGEHTGSIEPGKRADFVIFNARDYREIPYFAGSNHVRMVIKDGNVTRVS